LLYAQLIFHYDTYIEAILMVAMPHKDPKRAKEYHAKYMKEVWYPKNKEKHIGYVRRNKQRVVEFIQNYKTKGACADCGFSGKEFPYVLDF
jgi:hypothetical protein